jgi:hypothetical protein
LSLYQSKTGAPTETPVISVSVACRLPKTLKLSDEIEGKQQCSNPTSCKNTSDGELAIRIRLWIAVLSVKHFDGLAKIRPTSWFRLTSMER